MQFDLSLPQDMLCFSRYDNDFIEINSRVFTGPIKVNFNTVYSLEGVQFEQIGEHTFDDALQEERPELIIVGCGAKQKFIHPKITAKLAEQGIGIEVMVTPAALRTFNVLKGDGRRVWAWIWL